MTRTRLTVAGLAREAGVDLDEVLVTLWELGLQDLLRPSDRIPVVNIDSARRALGVASRSELRSIGYWCELLAVTPAEVGQLMAEHGVAMGSRAKKLPPGAVSRLKAISRGRGIDPLVGTIATPRLEALQRPRPVATGPGRQACDDAFEWEALGHERELTWLSATDILQIHLALANDFMGTVDPIVPVGCRSEHLLGSAAGRPQTCLGGTLKYTTVESAAAALLHAIILDHPFHNGNKRTALVATLVFLDVNGMVPTCTEDDLFKLVLRVAQHRMTMSSGQDLADREVSAINIWLCDRTRLVMKGEHPLAWRRLRRQLAAFGCELEIPGTVGNRINISRKVQRRGLLGQTRRVTLRTQVFYGDEGREVDVSTIKKIRSDLELDDEHGVDSLGFYASEPTSVVEFIARYRKTLDRLAKL